MKKRFLFVLVITTILTSLFVFIPVVYGEESGECDGTACGLVTCSGNDCDFGDFMRMANRVISFILFRLAPAFATIAFAMAGFKILTSGGNSGKVTEAKKMMWNIVSGYLIALAAWLIVRFIFNDTLVKDGFLFFLSK